MFQNQSLAKTNIANSNEQSINDSMLRMKVSNYANISSNDKELLVSIAFQCAKSGGIAVYKARGLYDLITPGNQNNWKEVDENCYLENEQANLKDNNSFSSINNLRIMPNPSNGKISIEFPNLDSKKRLMIYDVLGKVVYKKELRSEEKQLNIYLRNTENNYSIRMMS